MALPKSNTDECVGYGVCVDMRASDAIGMMRDKSCIFTESMN